MSVYRNQKWHIIELGNRHKNEGGGAGEKRWLGWRTHAVFRNGTMWFRTHTMSFRIKKNSKRLMLFQKLAMWFWNHVKMLHNIFNTTLSFDIHSVWFRNNIVGSMSVSSPNWRMWSQNSFCILWYMVSIFAFSYLTAVCQEAKRVQSNEQGQAWHRLQRHGGASHEFPQRKPTRSDREKSEESSS